MGLGADIGTAGIVWRWTGADGIAGTSRRIEGAGRIFINGAGIGGFREAAARAGDVLLVKSARS